jgi:glycosyltransferase involved in cell wall biosynthesis
MAGKINVTPNAQGRLREHVALIGSVPRSEIGEHYKWADVFLLPSICEGSATVTYEAMAAGLPVICTPNTGSVVRDGVEGFIVPVRDAKMIAERIEQLAANPEQRARMADNALVRADHFTLEAYGRRLLAVLANELAAKT